MKIGRTLSLALAGALFLATALAQEKEKPKMAGEQAMEMPKPAPEMTKWIWMVGTWNVTETHEKSEWGPGGPGKGTMTVTLGPGGFSHVSSYSSTGPMGKFSGRGISAWDPNDKVHRVAWADSMTPGVIIMECREEGKDSLCEWEGMMEGKMMKNRFRSTNPNPAGWTEVLETSVDGGPYQKMMTLEYKRAR